MKITIVGTGYVGLSNAILLAQNNDVTAYDIDKEKVHLINQRKSPLNDKEIINHLLDNQLNLMATTDKKTAYKNADYIIVAIPTDFCPNKVYFDTSSIDLVIHDIIQINAEATIIIRSTIPIGYTQKQKSINNKENIIFCPEFLREGKALYDNLYPSRIVVGDTTNKAKIFASLLQEGAKKEDIPTLFTGSKEAESIKLFSNSYLALRVAFFNEVDTYAEINGLNTEEIIQGIGFDPRIGKHYNNPSFGYGGYCLPKDTKQLLASYEGVPNNIIKAIVDSNVTRKKHIGQMIINKLPKIVGVYRLIMKTDSDNFRASAILDIMNLLEENSIEVIIYEPLISSSLFSSFKVENNLIEFKKSSDIIIVNRYSNELSDVNSKIYSRDIFSRD